MMSGFWDDVKEFAGFMWGDSWWGMESVGRWMVITIVVIVGGAVVFTTAGWISDRRFVASCYARGGHVHYSYRSVPGPVVIIGNVGVPTTSTVTTMTYAEGPEDTCKGC